MSDIKEQAEAIASRVTGTIWEDWRFEDEYRGAHEDVVSWIENALRLRESLSALVAKTALRDRRDHMCSQCAAIDDARAQIAAHDKLLKAGAREAKDDE